MGVSLRVLVVEDNEDDAQLLLLELARMGYATVHERVDTPEGMRAALERGPWDLVLSDYSMPRFSARAALAILQETGLDIPFIIVSGTVGEETAVEAMRAGANDFLLKDRLARMHPAIERELRESARRRERIAERAHAEAERDRLVVELQRAVEVRDSFLAIASHELRTPLTSLKLTVQGLKRAGARGTLATLPVERLGSDIDVIDRQISRIGLLIQNLLDVAYVTSDGMRLSREAVDLADVVRSVIARTNESTRPAPPIHVLTEPTVGVWDRLRVETIASNLIANAVKFGEGKPIDVTVAKDGPIARLTVADRGIGISPEEQARIFEKFERAVPVEHYGGFGLGLWIVRQIVDAHGGTIRVTSAPSQGSTFVVELPIAPALRNPTSESNLRT